MADKYSRELMKVSVAKMLQTIGWHTVQSTPLEIVTDLLMQYIGQLGKSINDFANEFGYTEPNLDHLGLAFREFNVNLPDLEEYVKYVDFGQPPTSVPKYPVVKEDHLNFLKPGSKEVVTRPVHIHEHLPPTFTIQEANENESEATVKQEEPIDILTDNTTPVFKRPAEISPGENFKRPRLLMEEEGRPTREISSVMMTTSGYISPAREGKLPESRTPLASLDTVAPTSTGPAQNNQNIKTNKPVKKVEKKKERVGKELFKPLDDKLNKKVPPIKDVAKLKQAKTINTAVPTALSNNFIVNNDVKVAPVLNNKSANSNKINKALAAARLKTEKFNTTITPVPMKSTPSAQPIDNVDKLFTEPDKKKVNIFKKISNVKNDKLESKIMKIKEDIKHESRESSPVLVIDESTEPANKVHHISNDITIELIDSKPHNKTPEKVDRAYYFEDSPPGTPLTPKTPEMISHSPPLTKEKRKRKDKSRVKKVQKLVSPSTLEPDIMDIEMGRPKTPEAQIEKPDPFQQMPPFPFHFPAFPVPGLIPPLANPLFPNLPLSLVPSFGKPPFSHVRPPVPLNFMQSLKHEEPLTPTRVKTPIEKHHHQQQQYHQQQMHQQQHHQSQQPHQQQHHLPHHPPPSYQQQPHHQQQHHQQHQHQNHQQQHQQHQPVQQPPAHHHQTHHQQQPPQQQQKQQTPPPQPLPPTPTAPPVIVVDDDVPVKPEKKTKEHKRDKKDKVKKKNKKDKVKDKAEKKKLKEEKKDKEKIKKEKKEKRKEKELRENDVSIPKLTLKLGSQSPRPETPDTRKLNIKPIVKKEEADELNTNQEAGREMSPELAKISALVTGQPKPKSANQTSTLIPIDNYSTSSTDSFNNQVKKTMFKPIPKIRTKEVNPEPIDIGLLEPPPAFYIEESVKEETAVVGPPPRTGPGPGRPRIHPIKPKPTKPNKQQIPIKDSDGNKVWICPACERRDDGSPMIGCDDCDAWYHWVCVGIQVPPDDNENWYCRYCLFKKQEVLQTDKKKKRKKREKKEH